MTNLDLAKRRAARVRNTRKNEILLIMERMRERVTTYPMTNAEIESIAIEVRDRILEVLEDEFNDGTDYAIEKFQSGEWKVKHARD